LLTYNKNVSYKAAFYGWFSATLYLSAAITFGVFQNNIFYAKPGSWEIFIPGILVGFVLSLFLALPIALVIAHIHISMCLHELKAII
jgi:hypothetical protein